MCRTSAGEQRSLLEANAQQTERGLCSSVFGVYLLRCRRHRSVHFQNDSCRCHCNCHYLSNHKDLWFCRFSFMKTQNLNLSSQLQSISRKNWSGVALFTCKYFYQISCDCEALVFNYCCISRAEKNKTMPPLKAIYIGRFRFGKLP